MLLYFAAKTSDEKASEESKIVFAKNPLTNTDFTGTKIAMLAKVTKQLVLDIQRQLIEMA